MYSLYVSLGTKAQQQIFLHILLGLTGDRLALS